MSEIKGIKQFDLNKNGKIDTPEEVKAFKDACLESYKGIFNDQEDINRIENCLNNSDIVFGPTQTGGAMEFDPNKADFKNQKYNVTITDQIPEGLPVERIAAALLHEIEHMQQYQAEYDKISLQDGDKTNKLSRKENRAFDDRTITPNINIELYAELKRYEYLYNAAKKSDNPEQLTPGAKGYKYFTELKAQGLDIKKITPEQAKVLISHIKEDIKSIGMSPEDSYNTTFEQESFDLYKKIL